MGADIDYRHLVHEYQTRVPKPTPSELRFLKAYVVTIQIIGSYYWLWMLGKLRGTQYMTARLDSYHRVNARRVRRTIISLQGLFIKVGQLFSIMTNILPDVFREELETVQDKVTPRPYNTIERRIRLEFGEPPEEVFKEFEREPIAAASLGQVHRAVLKTGEEVAVKVQHWAIDKMVKKDLRLIRNIMRIVQLVVPVQGLEEYYEQIRIMIRDELDFSLEADSIERIGANFVGNDRVHFPVVYREFSTPRVLTTSFVRGHKITNISVLDRMGVDRRQLAHLILTAYCQMIFIDGLYHADPHPGNLLVHEDGSITFLDFGACAELSAEMRKGIPELLEGLFRRSPEQILRAMRRMGFIARAGSEETSERIVEYFYQRFQEEVKIESFNLKEVKIDPQIGIDSLIDLRRMNIGIRDLTGSFQVPKDFVLLERVLLLLMGLVSYLDPDLNPTSVVYPYLQDFVLGKDRDWETIIIDSLREVGLSYLTLPQDIRRVLSKVRRGEIEVRSRGSEARAKLDYALGRQYIYTIFTLGFWGTSLYFHHTGLYALMALFGVMGLGSFTFLVGSALLARRFRKKL
jgi:predicted unusual protein kinase regulating ubiquinone biosynthesis (AarF/ABC1/UbiB family)